MTLGWHGKNESESCKMRFETRAALSEAMIAVHGVRERALTVEARTKELCSQVIETLRLAPPAPSPSQSLPN